jgi:preprotein translocase subunit SecE
VHGLQIYKRTQGKYTRLITFLAVLVLTAWGCNSLANKLGTANVTPYVQFGVPVIVLAALGVVMFLVVNRPKSADFLIATENEMKKVSWSSRKEVFGSTKVVIVTTFLLAAILFLVDFVFATLFQKIGVTG